MNLLPESQLLIFLITIIIIMLSLGIIFFFWYYHKKLLKLHETIIQKQNETEIQTRREIAYILHEELSKNLTFIRWNLKKMSTVINEIEESADTNELLDYCEGTNTEVDFAQQKIRNLHQSLYPTVLQVLDFNEALKKLTDEHQKQFPGMIILYIQEKFEKLSNNQKFNLYGLINLFVTNSIQHSSATEIFVEFTRKQESIELRLKDNGIGFDIREIEKKATGRGIFDLKSRAIALLPKYFNFQSEKDKGTQLQLIIEYKE